MADTAPSSSRNPSADPTRSVPPNEGAADALRNRPLRAMHEPELRRHLETALAAPRFVDEVLASAPFGTVGELLDAAERAASPLEAEDIEAALAHHPRIGEAPTGTGASAAFSRNEQASSDATDADLAQRLADGNRAYERRFDRVFLIRAAGRTRAEILAELHRRLELDDATESRIVGEQLREIALLRLEALFSENAA